MPADNKLPLSRKMWLQAYPEVREWTAPMAAAQHAVSPSASGISPAVPYPIAGSRRLASVHITVSRFRLMWMPNDSVVSALLLIIARVSHGRSQ